MRLPNDEVAPVITRFKRAQGHLGKVIAMMESGADCEDVLTQLAAVNKAISRGGYALVATGLEHCQTTGVPPEEGRQKLEKLFLALA
ncbi:metal-sensitive transcriptional regulator [Tomitella fengzijianii]|uniref:Metal-sensitive transcriptional regulator n=1 Tax=Tomitella fengzijianii TaxID=2597660 RepID=A0A516WZD5_9ACTN|nr:metal-sensitive transcriptional regulator [Tomitella fengzijianii]QDQ96209.1 metal-sensitive transcriptional regulator [Tomitella fengzijianii]